jgi:hypothetical protein
LGGHSAIGVEGDEDGVLCEACAGVADGGEIGGVAGGEASAVPLGYLAGVIGAPVEDDDGFEVAVGELAGMPDGIEAGG